MGCLSVSRMVTELMFILIPIATVLIFIKLGWLQMSVSCPRSLNSTADVVISNLYKCIDECWKKHDFGSDLESEDCYVIDVFVQDRDVAPEELSRRNYVRTYFYGLWAGVECRVKIRYNATGREISVFVVPMAS